MISNPIRVNESTTLRVSDLTTRRVLPSSLARKNTPDARLSRISTRLMMTRVLRKMTSK